MSTFLSNRLFTVSVLLLSFFIVFTAISFAQEEESEDDSLRQVRPLQVRETVADRVSERRTEIKEKNSDRKAELMEKVEGITDEAKRAALERIIAAFETINDNKTSRWAQALDKLSEVLERIKSKLEALDEEGVDTSSAVAKVTEAESAIADAAEAVETQSEKVYDVEFTDETTLREVIQPFVQGFKQDLRTTFSEVLAARDAVREAARALAGVDTNGNDSEQNLTP